MKTILMSIRPKWCYKIFTDEKTIEVRKTAPKPPFKVLVYCTKPSIKYQTICGCMVLNSDELYRLPDGTLKRDYSIELMCHDDYTSDNFLNGKVIGEFICEKADEISVHNDIVYSAGNLFADKLKNMCLTVDELKGYLGEKNRGYALGITGATLYDKPIVLSDLKSLIHSGDWVYPMPIKRPPQSWFYLQRETP